MRPFSQFRFQLSPIQQGSKQLQKGENTMFLSSLNFLINHFSFLDFFVYLLIYIGYQCSDKSIEPVACAASTYSPAGSLSCLNCPAGYKCSSQELQPVVCPQGYYSASGDMRCSLCPAGFYCADPSSQTAVSGSPNYALEGSTFESQVTPGYEWVAVDEPPRKCEAGTYWVTGTCTDCPLGSFCPNPAGTEAIACPNGYFTASTKQVACTPCPPGHKCAANNALPVACAAGEYALGATWQCESCPAGYSCPSAGEVPVACPVGTSSGAGQQTCTVCPDGSECSSVKSATQTPCTAGHYSTSEPGQPPICQQCPPGHFCAGGSYNQFPEPCPSGSYAVGPGNAACTACTAGNACPFPDAPPYACPTGYEQLSGGQTSCSPTDTSGTAACAAGNYAYPDPNACRQCPEGFECQELNSPPKMCITGYYSAAGAQFCSICEAGKKCPTPYQSKRVDCTDGFYSDAGSVECYPVPAHMSGAINSRPQWCAADNISKTGIKDCAQCAAGKQCPDDYTEIDCVASQFSSRAGEKQCFPYQLEGSDHAAIPSTEVAKIVSNGYYGWDGMVTTAGQQTTYDCPTGHQCLFPWMQNWVKCPAGWYSLDGKRSCQPCPEGKFCYMRKHDETDTTAGFFSPFGMHLNLVAPAGWAAAATGPLTPCQAGQYSLDNQGSCSECTSGKFCPYVSNVPMDCHEGMVTTAASQQTCKPCQVGEVVVGGVCTTITPGWGAAHPMFQPMKCLAGDFSTSVQISSSNQNDCRFCTGGYQCLQDATKGSDSSTQVVCPLGYFCSGKSSQTGKLSKFPCPAGYKVKSGATTGSEFLDDACEPCSAGNFCRGADIAETPCPAGYFCPTATKFGTQFPCLAGTYRSTTGATSVADCQTCTVGKYCPPGTGTPFDCPPGVNCNDLNSLICPKGQYMSGGTCVDCIADHFCPSGTAFPQRCPAGTKGTNGALGKANRFEDCLACDQGKRCPQYATNSATEMLTCQAGSGYICTFNTEHKQQLPCPPGMQDQSSGSPLTDYANCSLCPAGKACREGTGSVTGSSQREDECAPGHYCPSLVSDGQGTMHPRQYPCPGGTFSISTSLTAASGCQACTAGFYCPPGSHRQFDCPPGFFCPANTADYRDSPCPAGKYNSLNRKSAPGDCTQCPLGKYCPSGTAIPINCPKGTYSDALGADSADSSSTGGSQPCTKCPGGSQCPTEGLTNHILCGAGKFSPIGSLMCFTCQPGYKCATATGTAGATYEATPCSGDNCALFATYEISPCPVGHYCPGTALYAIPCPTGTIRDTTGASQVSDCTNSPAGFYADVVGSTSTSIANKKCSAGYICPAGSKSREQIPCPVGSYQSTEGNASGSCTACPAGQLCLGATIHPKPCPAGFYCKQGNNADPLDVNNYPFPCPKGTYGKTVALTADTECTQCPAGFYCAETGADTPTDLCDAGFLCTGGATTPQPLIAADGGEICPAGGYCEKGTPLLKPCQGGFYNPSTGKKTVFDCTECLPGFYCQGEALTTPSAACSDGYYCEKGSSIPDQYPAPPGYFTPNKVGTPLHDQPNRCWIGTYQNLYHQNDCKKCEPGFYCNDYALTQSGTKCPSGYYCTGADPTGVDATIGTITPQPCPKGFYNPTTHASLLSQCLQCPPGKYCISQGLSQPSGECGAGYFCTIESYLQNPADLDIPASGDARWGPCPQGHYCPQGTAMPFKCPAGTYSNQLKLYQKSQCTACTPGFYCETTGLTTPTAKCKPGFYCSGGDKSHSPATTFCVEGEYCPEGSIQATSCSAGTYQPNKYQSGCLVCPKGFFCVEGTALPQKCTAGHYCVEGTKTLNGTPCEAGKYQPEQGRIACLSCPPGYYCDTPGKTAILTADKCTKGYYCKGNSKTPTPVDGIVGAICPIGYYCNEGSAFPIKCVPGFACDSQGFDYDAMLDKPCVAGHYCLEGAITTQPTDSNQGGNRCPAGFYCPNPDPNAPDRTKSDGVTTLKGGAEAPYPCPPGKYRSTTDAQASTDCQNCPIGYYCEHYGSTTYKICDEGWYCDSNEVNAMPNGKYCPTGSYCSSGVKQPCPNGFYQDKIGQNQCDSCPAGFQCPYALGVTNGAATKVICGDNHYCKSGENLKTRCPAGYYTTNQYSQALTDCIICPAGYICECAGQDDANCVADFIKCPAGSYCPTGTGADANKQDCGPGFYCPEGTPERVPCPPGFYCDLATMATFDTAKKCQAGYFCLGQASQINPTDGTTGNICPTGHFCPEQSPYAEPCYLGTFNPDTGKQVSTDCIACSACDPVAFPSCAGGNQQCNIRGLSAPDSEPFSCQAGYYCPDSQNVIPCPVGAKCPVDSINFIVCNTVDVDSNNVRLGEDGTYQPNVAQSDCLPCPEGFYCPNDSNSVPSEAVPCPEGKYCGLKTVTPLDCAIGTYMPFKGTKYKSQCFPCQEGYECKTLALTTVVDQCEQGYYCPAGGTKIICPKGSFCPTGSAYFQDCPVGTYNDLTTQTSSAACLPCPNDKYCGKRGMQSSEALLCGNGFVCTAGGTLGAMSSTPTSGQQGSLCPAGKYCSSQIQGPQVCAIGFYQPNTGTGSCIGCPAGRLCDTTQMTSTNDCSEGNYCPAQSTSVNNAEVPCPAGTYSPVKHLKSAAECLPCKVGKYCSGGSIGVTGDCDAGFFCPIGQAAKNNYVTEYTFGSSIGGQCPKGHYCPAGTEAPVPCSPGTFMKDPGSSDPLCTPCSPGYYCDEYGMTDKTLIVRNKLCDAGYYCLGGSLIPNPTDGIKGNKCTPGNYCPRGSSNQVPCAAGTYETRAGSPLCQDCPKGFYCILGSSNPIECVNGFCPKKSQTPSLCLDGTYGSADLLRLSSQEDCPFCPEGKYCNNGFIQGDCEAGYFCDVGAALARDPAKICPAGHYCLLGTVMPTRCKQGLYQPKLGAIDSTWCQPCAEGQYCIENDSVSRLCPKGHFCPQETMEPSSCWRGTYNPEKGKGKSKDCKSCPKGYYCDSIGIDDYLKWPCPAGHFCDSERKRTEPEPCPAGTYRNATGAINATHDCWGCPEGHFCQEGSIFPVPCNPGTYCPTNSTQMNPCTPGTYCAALESSENICPEGYQCTSYQTDIYSKCLNGTYCPEGTRFAIDCPAGYFGSSRTDNYDSQLGCTACGRGQYSDQGSNTCEDCWPGYVCIGAAQSPNPTNLATEGGFVCPAGFYCPQGSYSAIACPIGTFNDEVGNGFANQCHPCPAGSYGNEVAATSCRQCIGTSTSDVGATTCRCVGLNRKYLADTGQCVCKTGYQAVDGSDAAMDGFADCERKIYFKCEDGQVRDAQGVCRDMYDCTADCDGGKGELQINFGICQCESIVKVDQLCNAECRESLPKVTFTSDGKISLYDPVSNSTVITNLENTAGELACTKADANECELVPVRLVDDDSGNFAADFALPEAIPGDNEYILERFVTMDYTGVRMYIEKDVWDNQNTGQKNGDDRPVTSWNWTSLKENQRRNLQQSGSRSGNELIDANQAQYIANPVVCSKRGAAILFGNLGEGRYPIYVKDSLLNTNQDFDYGKFDAISEMLKNSTISSFVFTFDLPGIYVFADSRNPAKQMVIAVMQDNRECPSDTAFSPQIYASMLKVGAFMTEVMTPPDWYLFTFCLVSFCVLITLSTLLVGYVFRDWTQISLPKAVYQDLNYVNAERSEPSDKRAVVSINTESDAFMFRYAGQEQEDDPEIQRQLELDAIAMGKPVKKTKKPKKKKKDNDLQLPQVENLKDKLAKHLKEINDLFGKSQDKDIFNTGDDSQDSSDDNEDREALNKQIAALKKLLGQNESILKGNDPDEIEDEQSIMEGLGDVDGNKLDKDELKRQIREEEADQRHEQLLHNLEEEDIKFEKSLEKLNQQALLSIGEKNNTVLQQQIQNAQDRGQHMRNLLKKDGAEGEEVQGLMNELADKMQGIEDLMRGDEARQNDFLARKLDARRNKRKALQEKLIEVEKVLEENESKKQSDIDKIVEDLQEELEEENKKLDGERIEAEEALKEELKQQKEDRLAEFNERLQRAKGDKNFQNVLNDFQKAQAKIDADLQKQFAKEDEKLQREMKARRARLKAQAQLKRQQKVEEIEKSANEQVADELMNKAKILENLKSNEEEEQLVLKLENDIHMDGMLIDEMEKKRRDEEAFRMQQARIVNKLKADDLKAARDEEKGVAQEIIRLAEGNTFDPYQEAVRERHRIQEEINQADSEAEKQNLLAQLNSVDEKVRSQLAASEADQDARLADKLAQRRKRRNKAFESERKVKQDQLQQRIERALDNSDQYQHSKNNMTYEALDEIVADLKLKNPPETIPAALEHLIDDKHQKELEDLLLKLFEQKTMELKEEVLALMEERLQKQQEARKQAADRTKGIDAILSRVNDPKKERELQAKKRAIAAQLEKDLADIERDTNKKENEITREVQKRTNKREIDRIKALQEDQLEEKQHVFEKYLPDSMMTDLNKKYNAQEKKEIEQFKEQLEGENAEKLNEMERAQSALDKEMEAQGAQLGKLTDIDKLLMKKELKRKQLDKLENMQVDAKVDAQEQMQKLKEEYEKDLDKIGGAYETERSRQFEKLQEQMESRRHEVLEAQEIAERKAAEEQHAQKVAKLKEEERIRELRKRKAKLEETLREGQKLIYKQCYSRPLYPFNQQMSDFQIKNEDFAWLKQDKGKVIQKEIMSRLMEKVSELETKVEVDAKERFFEKQIAAAGYDVTSAKDYETMSSGGMSHMSRTLARENSVASYQKNLYGKKDALNKIKNSRGSRRF